MTDNPSPPPTPQEIVAPDPPRPKTGRSQCPARHKTLAPRTNPDAPLVAADKYRKKAQTSYLITDEKVAAWENRLALFDAHYKEVEEGDTLKAVQVLERIACGCRIGTALAEVGRDWPWLNSSVVFNKQLNALYEVSVELARAVRKHRLEDEAIRRAEEGWDEPVYTQTGKLAGYKKRFSDALLAMVLRAHDPERYGDRATVQGGVVLNVNLGIDRTLENEPPAPPIDIEAIVVNRAPEVKEETEDE
jgi:hypothetical protein